MSVCSSETVEADYYRILEELKSQLSPSQAGSAETTDSGSVFTQSELSRNSTQRSGKNSTEAHSEANPVFAKGDDPFLFLAKETSLGFEGELEERTDWTRIMTFLRVYYERYLSTEGYDYGDEVPFGDESAIGFNDVTGSIRCKNGIVSIFFKISVMGREIVPYSSALRQTKPIPSSVISEMNQTHKELDEIALGKEDRASRADAVEPSLEKIAVLDSKGRPRATTKLVGNGAAGWAVVTYDLHWSKVYRFYGLTKLQQPVPADTKNA